jgi:hypothetical protein
MEPPLIESAEDELTSERLVSVRRYRDLSEALVARTVLESGGIPCFLCDENFIRLDWGLSNFAGGLRLQVRPEDEAQAEELLSQPIPETIPFAAGTEYEQPHCPRCGSTDITFEGADRLAPIASILVLGAPVLPSGGTSWVCNVCHSRWREDGAAPEAG